MAQTRGLKLACIVGPMVAFLLAANRLSYRIMLGGGFGMDDLAIVLATVRDNIPM